MKFLFLATCIFFFFGNCSPCFTDSDANLTISLLQNLQISSCIILKQSCREIPQILKFMKQFSQNNIYFSNLGLSEFLRLFVRGKIPEKTMIVLKANDWKDAVDMTKQFGRKVS